MLAPPASASAVLPAPLIKKVRHQPAALSARVTVSVILPSYNERENMPEAIERITRVLGDQLLEIIVIDDDSPDRTWEAVEHLRNPRCRLVRRMDKRGLASALADGTRTAKGDVVVWLDCDLGIPPEDILKLIAHVPQYDVAVGSRYVPGGTDARPRWRALLSYAFNLYARIVLGYPFWDWTSGFAATKREVLEQNPLSNRGFGEYFIQWVYGCFRKGFTVIEVPYRYGLRKEGVSKTDGNLLVFLRLGLFYAWRVILVRLGRV